MTPTQTAIVALLALGLVVGPLLARLAARRTLAQPLAVAAPAERRLMVAVTGDPALTTVAFDNTGLTGEHFAHPGRGAAWDALAAAHRDHPTAADAVGAARVVLAGDADALAQLDLALAGPSPDGSLRDDDAARVVLDADDRRMYPSSAPVDATGGDPPLARRYLPASRTRQVRGAVFVGGGFGVAAWLAPAGGAQAVWGAIALSICVATGYVLSEVDHDTLLIDYATFFVGALGAWAAAVAAALSGGHPDHLLAGVVMAVGWAVGFEALNKAYKLIRGFDGMGAGDTLIVLMTAGVPTVISGSALVGMYSVIAAAVLLLVVSAPKLASGNRNLQTRLAMGPFLAAGWVACWAALRIAGVA